MASDPTKAALALPHRRDGIALCQSGALRSDRPFHPPAALLMYTITPLLIGAIILLVSGLKCMRARHDPKKLQDEVNSGSTIFLVFTYVIFSAVSTKIFQTYSVRPCFSEDPERMMGSHSLLRRTEAH